jgi:glycosyltransferase involved in cell wall biosynthesis
MATFNGERYVEEQLRSILEQLGDGDEVVLIDDASTDDTLGVVTSIGDGRIRVMRHSNNRGYVKTFEEAIMASRGEYILLSDQDDVWLPGRVNSMLRALRSDAVVASNMTILGSGERPRWWMNSSQARQWRRNLVRILAGASGYYGCGMGIRRDFVRVATPFPPFLYESHDLWIALLGNRARSVGVVETPTLERRVHGDNVTPNRPRSLLKVLEARVMLLRLLLVSGRRLHRAAASSK